MNILQTEWLQECLCKPAYPREGRAKLINAQLVCPMLVCPMLRQRSPPREPWPGNQPKLLEVRTGKMLPGQQLPHLASLIKCDDGVGF
jgi:hypothetical protein